MTNLESVWTPQLGRHVLLRPGTSDRRTWADTFGGAGGYHVPPPFEPAPRVVLDLGANIGLTAAHYKALWPAARVVAVEMDSGNARLAGMNGAGEVIVAAVGGTPGVGSYRHEGVEAEAYTFTPATAPPSHFSTTVTTLTDLAKAFHPDFVKMDVEGSEWGILDHAHEWATLVPKLLIELHPDDAHPDDTPTLLKAAIGQLEDVGYEAHHHPPHPRAVWATCKDTGRGL